MGRAGGPLLAALAFGAVAVAAPSAAADTTIPSCTYSYNVTGLWSGGFSAQLTIGYELPAATSGWTIGFDFLSAGQHVTAGWNAGIIQIGNHVTISNGPFAQSPMPADGSISVGFLGSYTTSNPNPVHVTFDGVACSSVSWNG